MGRRARVLGPPKPAEPGPPGCTGGEADTRYRPRPYISGNPFQVTRFSLGPKADATYRRRPR